jgi:hypothetical protein
MVVFAVTLSLKSVLLSIKMVPEKEWKPVIAGLIKNIEVRRNMPTRIKSISIF